jgi:cation transporter-like permease
MKTKKDNENLPRNLTYLENLHRETRVFADARKSAMGVIRAIALGGHGLLVALSVFSLLFTRVSGFTDVALKAVTFVLLVGCLVSMLILWRWRESKGRTAVVAFNAVLFGLSIFGAVTLVYYVLRYEEQHALLWMFGISLYAIPSLLTLLVLWPTWKKTTISLRQVDPKR